MRHEMTQSWQATWEDIPASKDRPAALGYYWFSVLYAETLSNPWACFPETGRRLTLLPD